MNSLLAALFASAFVFIQCYISGTRLAFSLPAYGVLAAAAILSGFVSKNETQRVSGGCWGGTIIFFAFLLVRGFFSPVEYLARADFYMILGCLVVYGLTVRNFARAEIRGAILAVFLILAVVEVMVGAIQFAHADSWMPFGLLRGGGQDRASGTFISSIHFAGYLEAVAPFALGMAFWGARNIALRVLLIGVAVVCYCGVAISGSRGGWLSSLFSLLVFLALSLDLIRRTNRSKLDTALYCSALGALLLPLGAYLLMGQSAMMHRRMGELANIGEVMRPDSKYDARIYNWQAALDQWRVQPLLGTGAGTHLYYGRQFRRPQLQADPEHAHSDYLELLAEYGLVGALGMAAFLAAHLRKGIRSYRELAAHRSEEIYQPTYALGIHVGALAAVSAYLAHSVVDFNLHLPGNALLFAFIFGILASPGPPPSERLDTSIPEENARHWSQLLLPALGLWLAISGAPKLRAEIFCEKARVAVRDGRLKEAVAFANRALESEQRNPFLFHHLGDAHRLLAEHESRNIRKATLDAAEQAYRAGIALFPQDEDLWVRLGQTLDALAKYADARKAYEQAIALDPNLGILHAYYAHHLRITGREAEADAALARGEALSSLILKNFLDRAAEPAGLQDVKMP